MKEPATFPGAVWNGLSDNPTRSSLNDDIPPDTRDWDRIVAETIATQTFLAAQTGVNGIPYANTATGSPHNMYVLANSSGNTWMDLEFAMQSIIADNTDMDNRYESYLLDPLVLSVNHGQPVRLYRTAAAVATGQDDSGNLTANTVNQTAAYNGWLLTVVESPTGNRTNPVSVVDTPNQTIVCTVPDTGNTTWNAIVTSWNAAQGFIVADLVAGNYEAGVTSTGNSTILMASNGVDDEVRITTLNLTANAKEATVFGLVYDTGSYAPGDPIMVQTGGTMTFNAEQTVNTFNTSTLDASDLLVPGESYYAAAPRLENTPESANAFCVPIGTVISPTKLRLRLGLPVKTTVGA